ncbi:enoyl-CoA hydratase [Salipiger aestuarii]|uniref:3-hydroxyisobutyryl-CoA hydrolase n=1 Tax=Salipiger aestuarii TaxID=568098 RepID=UPI00025B8935|nr:3-hydroxyisobutyryl-CoA hydrolase [Salipiger aestuarii]EIE52298.1 enoyl-CoA hydratase/isomerase family protein [Citreicella sp. 357]KAA8609050.1 enoyl-CoA hydratase [Salipiger aestuarii]KAA8614251.1 enoyl-CoA hydratase [Salipiger aestuarii]
MPDIHTRIEGRAGRITLTRPQALNALTHDMCLAIETAIDAWRKDDAVALVILDAQGERAFCAGGDIGDVWRAGMAGDYDLGRRFWADEYRMNAKLADYPKPIIAFLHGFVMGGGVGLGGHVSHRIVGESTQISMPECGIGFVPDVGGTLLLARAPGRVGDYLGLTSARMGPGDALFAGFADLFIPQAHWPALTADLCQTGDAQTLAAMAAPPPESALAASEGDIETLFAGETVAVIENALAAAHSDLATGALKALRRNAPLSMALTLEMLRRLRAAPGGIREALQQEYRVSYRAVEQGDFLEGVRAQIIDKDRDPKWRFQAGDVTPDKVAAMLAPLGDRELTL